jgi:hypothetical protein
MRFYSFDSVFHDGSQVFGLSFERAYLVHMELDFGLQIVNEKLV